MSQPLTILEDPHRLRSHDYLIEQDKQSSGVSLPTVSIIIPTYNESKNIVEIIMSIKSTLGNRFSAEVIVVDDNSPDGTANLVERFARKEEGRDMNTERYPIQILRRQAKKGLSSAILDGILHSSSDIAVVMDADFSHPPELLPEMINPFRQRRGGGEQEVDLVIASRYAEDGRVEGWSIKRQLISLGATKIAQYILGIKKVKDPMSGFFAVRRGAVRDIKFDAIGYKILLEILLKAKLRTTIELPYSFKDRKEGSSKLDNQTIIQYLKACRKLHSYKQQQKRSIRRGAETSQVQKGSGGLRKFANQAGKFYLIGASGLLVNYGFSFLIAKLLFNMYYMHAAVLGIGISIVSNFLLNKLWTFNDRNFGVRKVARQGFWFLLSSIVGIAVQISLIYYFVQDAHIEYILSLGLAVLFASSTNFLAAKKLAFKERLMM